MAPILGSQAMQNAPCQILTHVTIRRILRMALIHLNQRTDATETKECTYRGFMQGFKGIHPALCDAVR